MLIATAFPVGGLHSFLLCLRFSAKKVLVEIISEKNPSNTNCKLFQVDQLEETVSLLPRSDTTLMKNPIIAFKALTHSLSLD